MIPSGHCDEKLVAVDIWSDLQNEMIAREVKRIFPKRLEAIEGRTVLKKSSVKVLYKIYKSA